MHHRRPIESVGMRKVALLVLLAAAVCAAQTESPVTRDGDFWVRTIQGSVVNGRLRLDTVGNVALQGSPSEQSRYSAAFRVRADNAREAEALLDRIIVKTGTEGGWTYIKVTPPRFGLQGFDLRISAPRALRQVRIVTGGGNVKASDLDGDLVADSGGGEIDVDHITGAGRLRTGGGNLSIGTVGGSVQAFSAGGTIRAQNLGSDATVETAGGEIFVHRAGGPLQASTGGGNIRVDDAGSTVIARTAGGLIQIQHAGGPVTAESSGGAIQVDSANGVRCEAAGGAIRLRNVAGPVHAFANSGSIMADFAGGSIAESVLSTNAGDITVLLPSNVALTVQAMNESGGTGRIVSDFPQVRMESGRIPGGPVVAEGSLNGGGPMLRVNVVGGTIYLRRAK